MRIVVLGCGRIGRMHAELLTRRVDGVQLAGVHDVVPPLAHSVGAQLGVPVFRTAADALGAGIDTVAICTTTDTHVELIGAAAKLGVAVFCEKPIALDLAEVDIALEAVNVARIPLHVGFNRRFDPAHRAVHDAVASGEIGALRTLRITSRDPEPPPLTYVQRSGGLFVDMTIHDFDLARFITGSEVVEVFASGAVMVDPAIGEVGDVDTAVVVMRHVNGATTVIDNCRQCAYGYDQRVEAFGSAGSVASENPPVRPTVRRDGEGTHRPPVPTFFLDRYADSYVLQWRDFVDAVAEGRPTPVTGADGRAALALALSARRSMRERRPVSPTPGGEGHDAAGESQQRADQGDR